MCFLRIKRKLKVKTTRVYYIPSRARVNRLLRDDKRRFFWANIFSQGIDGSQE